jgi:D-cysteine desulfhydrase
MGYVEAGRELAKQIREGVLPEPDVCVVALGSGGTAAGLAAGFAAEGLATRVVGVCVSTPPWVLRRAASHLAHACVRRGAGGGRGDPRPLALTLTLTMDARFLGAGYGHRTLEGDDATALAHAHAGLVLDPTYTAKTFAAALWFVRARQAANVLYWHTLSSAPMAPLWASGVSGEGDGKREPERQSQRYESDRSLPSDLRALVLPEIPAGDLVRPPRAR